MTYQSPISPGYSWYEASVGERPAYPALDGDRTCDVAIIGGGFTGLSAAAHLASAGTSVTLIEAHRFGDGASGRNGGQLGTGQRAWAEELEAELGLQRAKSLFDLAEEAKAHLLEFASVNGIDIEFGRGQLSVAHKRRYLDDYRRHADIMAERFGYPHISFMDAPETARQLGSTRYFGGTRDTGTGHIHPLKLVVGTARVAAAAGAALFENTRSTGITSNGGKVRIVTASGAITAEKALIAVNAHGGDLEPVSAARVMPIGSFIGATVPLGAGSPVIPGGSRSTIPVLSCAISASPRTAACFWRPRDLRHQGSEGHTHPHTQADRGGLSGAEGRRDHAWLGRLCGHHPAAQALRARSHAERDFCRRLFRSRRHAVEFRRKDVRRNGGRQP